MLAVTWIDRVTNVSNAQRREWWQRNLDKSFRLLEGKHGRTRDPYELQQGIAEYSAEFLKKIDEFTENFQQDVESYTQRLKNSMNGSSSLWTPLPNWRSWKKKKSRIESLEKDKKIIDGRIVRGGLVPGGGRVHMTLEEKLAKIEEKKNVNRARATQILNSGTKLLRRNSQTKSEHWIPKVAGRLGSTRLADRETFLGGWETVGTRLGRVKLGRDRITA